MAITGTLKELMERIDRQLELIRRCQIGSPDNLEDCQKLEAASKALKHLVEAAEGLKRMG
jgi:hypothetical protein